MKKNYFTTLYAWKTTNSNVVDYYPYIYTDTEIPQNKFYNSKGDLILELDSQPYFLHYENYDGGFYLNPSKSPIPPFISSAYYYRDSESDIHNNFVSGTYTYDSKHITFDSEFTSIPTVTITWFNPFDSVLQAKVQPTNITTTGFDIPSFSNNVTSPSDIYFNFTYSATGMNNNSIEAYNLCGFTSHRLKSEDDNEYGLIYTGNNTDISPPSVETYSIADVTVNITPNTGYVEVGEHNE